MQQNHCAAIQDKQDSCDPRCESRSHLPDTTLHVTNQRHPERPTELYCLDVGSDLSHLVLRQSLEPIPDRLGAGGFSKESNEEGWATLPVHVRSVSFVIHSHKGCVQLRSKPVDFVPAWPAETRCERGMAQGQVAASVAPRTLRRSTWVLSGKSAARSSNNRSRMFSSSSFNACALDAGLTAAHRRVDDETFLVFPLTTHALRVAGRGSWLVVSHLDKSFLTQPTRYQ